MKKYIRPYMEVIELETADIIQTSGTLTNGGSNGNFVDGGGEGEWGTVAPASTQQTSLVD